MRLFTSQQEPGTGSASLLANGKSRSATQDRSTNASLQCRRHFFRLLVGRHFSAGSAVLSPLPPPASPAPHTGGAGRWADAHRHHAPGPAGAGTPARVERTGADVAGAGAGKPDPVANVYATLGAGDSVRVGDVSQGRLAETLARAGVRTALIGQDIRPSSPVRLIVPNPTIARRDR